MIGQIKLKNMTALNVCARHGMHVGSHWSGGTSFSFKRFLC